MNFSTSIKNTLSIVAIFSFGIHCSFAQRDIDKQAADIYIKDFVKEYSLLKDVFFSNFRGLEIEYKDQEKISLLGLEQIAHKFQITNEKQKQVLKIRPIYLPEEYEYPECDVVFDFIIIQDSLNVFRDTILSEIRKYFVPDAKTLLRQKFESMEKGVYYYNDSIFCLYIKTLSSLSTKKQAIKDGDHAILWADGHVYYLKVTDLQKCKYPNSMIELFLDFHLSLLVRGHLFVFRNDWLILDEPSFLKFHSTLLEQNKE